ncbi:hypothetical protein ACFVT5_09235 [Streptomyces sp. NPDC058001]|uniref:hypothetical protein n=1 Tax=Streptomyces sp. NPDC058001 TaxID=3346300 RepID=UPI0036E3717B
MSATRLAPGVALVTVPGRGLAVRTPDGEFLRVDTGDVSEAALLRHLDRRSGADTGQPVSEPELARLERAFEAAGYLVPADVGPPAGAISTAALAGRRVLLVGDPVLVDPLARGAGGEGADVRLIEPDRIAESVADARAAEVPTAVVWCLDSPVPPGSWDEADRLPRDGVAWLRCHREGCYAWVEPPAVAEGDVTSEDVRLRRLAATAAYRELAAYWAGSCTEDTGPAHTTASGVLTAALLLGDLVAWAAGERRTRRRLRRIDLRALTVTEHVVLPVPRVGPLGAHGPGSDTLKATAEATTKGTAKATAKASVLALSDAAESVPESSVPR